LCGLHAGSGSFFSSAPRRRFRFPGCRVMITMLNWLFFLVLAVWILDAEDERGTPKRRLRLIKPS
jgi:hypothetical protein